MDGRGKVGRRLSGLWHNHFIRWVGMDGRGKVGRDLSGQGHNHFFRWLGMVARGKVGEDLGGFFNKCLLTKSRQKDSSVQVLTLVIEFYKFSPKV